MGETVRLNAVMQDVGCTNYCGLMGGPEAMLDGVEDPGKSGQVSYEMVAFQWYRLEGEGKRCVSQSMAGLD